MLQTDVPVLQIRRSQISLKPECRFGQGNREGARERIVGTQRKQPRNRKKQIESKERRVEIKAFTWRKRRLVEVDSVTPSQNRNAPASKRPREPHTRRKV